MELYRQFWLQCSKGVVFRIGVGLLLIVTIIPFFVSEKNQDTRALILILFAVGIIITNIGFITIVPKRSGFRDAWNLFDGFMCAVIFGIGGGFLFNSLLAEIFEYSLKTVNGLLKLSHLWS